LIDCSACAARKEATIDKGAHRLSEKIRSRINHCKEKIRLCQETADCWRWRWWRNVAATATTDN